jgi:hypothetical protein
MTTKDTAQLIQLLLDTSADPCHRASAARRLADDESQDALDALLEVASEDEAVVGWAAGESIAAILIRRGEVYDAPLWAFTGASGEAFDTAVARHQRAHPATWDLDRKPSGV